MRAAVSVVLIRENAEQMTGSGCCGKLEGDSELLSTTGVFEHARQHQRHFGVLARAVRKFFPAAGGRELASLVIVDPRNQLYLIDRLWRDVWHYRPGFWAGLQTLTQCFSLPAVVVNGRVLSRRGQAVDPDLLCHRLQQILQDVPGKVKRSERQGASDAGQTR